MGVPYLDLDAYLNQEQAGKSAVLLAGKNIIFTE